ncbi:peptidoglycan editing factor PgeF [Novosphingobium guangzhouense]|uniref:Purine nucleoside phosphorylase n=1 Tax=Novosphingobium guangzhouense TaxID=1850347 RepID=A0A2K2FZ93_9SPHN|nr:peptidoglycan editing factor PgeF [Novosphingobium guangzhouense]PNU04078.1 polyphenol oxidase [Novosphingobium guangzhouense]
MAESVEVNRATLLDGIPHGFLGRRGGVSEGEVAGLNVGRGSGDDLDLVERNRALAAGAVLPGARLVTVYQVHSADCVTLGGEPWPEDAPVDQRPKADAIVTDRPGAVLGILTADCAPVLFADREAGVIGAAHAGWRGAIGGITDSTIAAMEALGARRTSIVAAVGPCIAQDSYEVDAAFRERFLTDDLPNARFFREGRTDHFQFDLEGYVLCRLRLAGISRVEGLRMDTYAETERFYSFRRATHRGELSYGRQISLIGL